MCLVAVLLGVELALLRARRARRRIEGVTTAPAVPLPRPDNLPEAILDEQLGCFRITGQSPGEGLPRAYCVRAKHAGAAMQKARQWGLCHFAVERVNEPSP